MVDEQNNYPVFERISLQSHQLLILVGIDTHSTLDLVIPDMLKGINGNKNSIGVLLEKIIYLLYETFIDSLRVDRQLQKVACCSFHILHSFLKSCPGIFKCEIQHMPFLCLIVPQRFSL